MDRVLADARLAVRMLARRPGFALLALLTLTIGVGANTAVFGLINSVFLKPLPQIHDPARLVEISRRVGGDFFDVSYAEFGAMRARRELLVDAAAYTPTPVSIGSEAREASPVVRMALNVTGNYFDVLGVRPGLGRYFAPEESFHPTVTASVVISDRLWHERFAADPSVIGRTLHVNGVALEVIGVAPPAFRGQVAGMVVDVYVPVGVPVPGLHSAASLDEPGSAILQVIARLRPGVSRERAAAALGAAAAAVAPSPNVAAGRAPGRRASNAFVARVDAFSPVPAVIRGAVAAFFAILLVVSGLLLTMTCVNVAGMILSRATERRTEIAVRRALGATRRRIVAQLLTESTVLFLAAGVTGAVLAAWATPILSTFKPPLPPGFSIDLDLRADWRVIVYASLVAVGTGLLFSLAPALRATRSDLSSSLREHDTATRSRARLRAVLVGTQVAATVLLLVVAGLFVRALSATNTIDPGWDATGVHVASMDLELTGTDEARGRMIFEEVTRRVGALPGVQVAALAAKLPFSGQSSLGAVTVDGQPPPEGLPGHAATFNRVSPGYFKAMGISLLRGRDVSDADGAGAPRVAVVNEAMSSRLFPGGNAVGRRFRVNAAAREGTEFEVIGVVENTKYRRLAEVTPNFYFIPYRQMYNAQMVLHVRLDPGAPSSTTTAVREVVAELAPELPIESPRPLRDALAVYFLPQRIAAWVAGVMGLIGILLGAVGVYGVAAIAVAQRRRELGIRLALGARPADVVALLLKQGLRAPLVGQVSGFALALGATRGLSSFLGVVSPLDPLTFGGVALGLTLVTALATWAPARRAAGLDPVETLRN